MGRIAKAKLSRASTSSRVDDFSWAMRCEYWSEDLFRPAKVKTSPRREHLPLVINGHGARLYVSNGALIVQSGYTHHPQRHQEWRFFPHDTNMPSKIISLDGSGSISLDALDWLASQNVPLIRIDWRGNVQASVGWAGKITNLRMSAAQFEAKKRDGGLEIAKRLIDAKIRNSISTINLFFDVSKAREINRGLRGAQGKLPFARSVGSVLGIEGIAAVAYFEGWQSLPLNWKGTGRKPIPLDWYRVGPRSSATRERLKNKNASHPVNAMLNYTYAVLESQVRTQIVVSGLDPDISFLHSRKLRRPGLVFDLMEPLRPIADRIVLEIIQTETFHPTDFQLRRDGVCRLNPALAKVIAKKAAQISYRISQV